VCAVVRTPKHGVFCASPRSYQASMLWSAARDRIAAHSRPYPHEQCVVADPGCGRPFISPRWSFISLKSRPRPPLPTCTIAARFMEARIQTSSTDPGTRRKPPPRRPTRSQEPPQRSQDSAINLVRRMLVCSWAADIPRPDGTKPEEAESDIDSLVSMAWTRPPHEC